MTSIGDLAAQARTGGAERNHAKAAAQGKLFARERLRLLLDDADLTFEDGLLANAMAGDLPADGVATGNQVLIDADIPIMITKNVVNVL